MTLIGLVIPSGGFKTTLSQTFVLDDSPSNLRVIDIDDLFDFTKNDVLYAKWQVAKNENTQDKWNIFNQGYYDEVGKQLNELTERLVDENRHALNDVNFKIFLLAHHWEILQHLNCKIIKVLLLKDEKFKIVLENERNIEKRQMMIMNRRDVEKYSGEIIRYDDVTELRALIHQLSASALN